MHCVNEWIYKKANENYFFYHQQSLNNGTEEMLLILWFKVRLFKLMTNILGAF